MSEPFLGEIRIFGGSFAPRGWALCAGQLMSISQNSALFSILGTTYGGDGRVTFGIPDLRGRMPCGQGNGPGLQPVQIGELAGTQTVTLTQNQMPAHTHLATFTGTGGGAPLAITVTVPTAGVAATLPSPDGNIPAQIKTGLNNSNGYAPTTAATGSLGGVTAAITGSGGITGGTVAVALAGNSQPVPTMPPYLGMNFIIALEGIFPSRN